MSTINIIGNAPNQVPTNADLGSQAFLDVDPYADSRSTSTQVATGTTVTLDSFGSDSYRTALYTAQAFYGSDVYACTVLISHNGSTVYYKELGNVTSLSLPVSTLTFDATLSGGVVSFRLANSTGSTVQAIATRTALDAY
jgi:hypothetical protein